jgi:hypothetical protein
MRRHLGGQLQLWLAVAAAFAGGAALCRQPEPRDHNAVPKTAESRWKTASDIAAAAAATAATAAGCHAHALAPPFSSLLPEVFKQRPLRFLGGVHLDLGMVVVVLVVELL